MIHSFLDKFGIRKKKQVTPAEPNPVLNRPEPGNILAMTNLSTGQESEKLCTYIM